MILERSKEEKETSVNLLGTEHISRKKRVKTSKSVQKVPVLSPLLVKQAVEKKLKHFQVKHRK